MDTVTLDLTRTKTHEQALICIFEYLFYTKSKMDYKKPIEEIISDVMEVPFDECDVFFKAIIFETIKNKAEYIDIIQGKLKSTWSFDRLCLTDQAILLLFTSEIMNARVPLQVGIDVAIDLAHRYCQYDSYKYINRVLDRIGKENA